MQHPTTSRSPLALRSMLLAGCFASLLACSAPEEEVSSSDTAYNTTLDMAQLMTMVLEPAADSLWGSGGWVLDASGYEELYPTTDEGWDFVAAQAAVVAESGNLMAIPGRAMDNNAWMVYSEGLAEAGLKAMTAAEARNKEDFFQAGAQIYSVCTACHQAYNPDILNRFDSNTPSAD